MGRRVVTLSGVEVCAREKIALIVFFLFPLFSFSQSNREKFKTLSKAEKRWVIFHPFIAKKAMNYTEQVLHVCDSLKKDSALDGDGNGGHLDAFRHSYWMALLSQHINPKKAYKLSLAHEKGNKEAFKKKKIEDGAVPDSMSCVMDIINNQLGIQIGLANRQSKTPMTDLELITFVKQKIIKGEMRILLKDENKNFLTCEGGEINLKNYNGKWCIPKCLVKSNVKGE